MSEVTNSAAASSANHNVLYRDENNNKSNNNGRNHTHENELAYCIVWSPLPPITWLIPFVGHTGITDSRGVASDFQGPYTVGDRGHMAFGSPTRALYIYRPSGLSSEDWDHAIDEANQIYRGRMHNICCDNCHSHVANALNRMPVKAYGIAKWDMVKIALIVFFRARFLSWTAVLWSWGPFIVLLTLFLVFV